MLHRYILIAISPKYSTLKCIAPFAFIIKNLGRTSDHTIYCLISLSLLVGHDKQPLPAASVLTCCHIGDDDTKSYLGFCY